MVPGDGVDIDVVVSRRTPWRGALIGVGTAIAAGLLLMLAPSPAHADDDPGLLGGALDGLTAAASDVAAPVLTTLPDVRALPIAGPVVGAAVDSPVVQTLTRPVSGALDGLLGDTVAELPLVGGLLGDRPVAGVIEVLVPSPAPATDAASASIVASGTGILLSAGTPLLAPILLAPVDDLGVVVVAGAESLYDGLGSIVGDIAPTSAVTSAGSSSGPVAAVLGAGLLLLLASGRTRRGVVRAPPSPVYATDTSPD